jgi:hypothetical protein
VGELRREFTAVADKRENNGEVSRDITGFLD